MKKYIVGLLCALTFSLHSGAQPSEQAQLRDPVPATHTVVKGDTLWDISSTFLQNPWMWPEIWHVNAQIENPHLIYPGDVIRLIYVDGQPRLTVDTSGRTFKLSPTVRALTPEEAIETIPLDEINSWLSRSRIVSKEELDLAPYVVAGKDAHLLVGAGDSLYARGQFPNTEAGAGYGILRRGDVYMHPTTKEVLGYKADDIGSAIMRTPAAADSDIHTMSVTRTTEEVRIGDRFLTQEERAVDSTFYPSAPDAQVEAAIVSVERGVTQVGKLSVVVLSAGEREGLASGNVLAIYKKGARVKDRVSKKWNDQWITLPDERAGLVMVFRTFEKMSLGLVLEAEFGVTVGDTVKNP